MYTLLIILHILVAFVMVGVILLQAGKGAEIGATFGGSSQTVFGSRGAGTFLSKVTVVAATIFMLTSLSLAVLSKQLSSSSTIGLDKPAADTTPASGEPAQDQHQKTHDPDAPASSTPAPAKP